LIIGVSSLERMRRFHTISPGKLQAVARAFNVEPGELMLRLAIPVRAATRPEQLFLRLLHDSVGHGTLRLRSAGGEALVGAGAPEVVVRVHRERLFSRVLALGSLGLGEAFMDGDFALESGELHQLVEILIRARVGERLRHDPRLLIEVGLMRAAAMVRGAWGNVQHHYDAGDELFESFLDPTLTYSCGYARSPGDDLAALQTQKLERICKKLQLRPGERLLDIGCGFGGLLIHAAQNFGIRGTGITVAKRHCERARERVREAGVADRVTIELRDHTSLGDEPPGAMFDKIVSVGMMEHLQPRDYRPFVAAIRKSLARGGMGLLHTIGCQGPRNEHDPFIQKYIFPGSNLPRLSEITRELERRHLPIVDVENLIRHYALTLDGWLANFRAHRSRLDRARYPERFQRMWEFYLSLARAAAMAAEVALYQVLFTDDAAAPFPLHRV
jgi:cyclopropane-fatty-acyl-phospholipid synthase